MIGIVDRELVAPSTLSKFAALGPLFAGVVVRELYFLLGANTSGQINIGVALVGGKDETYSAFLVGEQLFRSDTQYGGTLGLQQIAVPTVIGMNLELRIPVYVPIHEGSKYLLARYYGANVTNARYKIAFGCTVELERDITPRPAAAMICRTRPVMEELRGAAVTARA